MTRFRSYPNFIIVVFFLFLSSSLFSQNDSIFGTKLIDSYLVKEQINKADSALKSQILHFKSKKQIDSLYQYPYYVGKIALLKNDSKTAIRVAEKFVDDLRKETLNRPTIYRSLVNLADLYDELARHDKALIAGKEALKYILELQNVPHEEIGEVRYNVGISAYNLDSLSLAKTYFQEAAREYEMLASHKERLADAYNAMGAVSWTFNKLDSAQYYYEKAIKAVELSDAKDIMKLYLSTVFRTNIALLQESQGKVFEAIETQKGIITDSKIVTREIQDELLKQRSKRTEALAISNMGAMYHDLGHFSRANELLRLSFQKKKTLYEPSDARLTNNLIMIAQLEISLREFDKGIETLDNALAQLKLASGDYVSKNAEIFSHKAEIYNIKGDINQASQFYNLSNKLYQEAYSESFSREYLIFLRKYALFQVENSNQLLAIKTSKKAYDYALKNAGDDSFLVHNHILNLANVYYKTEKLEEVKLWIQKGNLLLDEKINKSQTGLDSIQLEFNKPGAILLEAKTEYKLSQIRDTTFLKKQIKKLNDAVLILERRKRTIFNNNDIIALLSEYKSINDFAKRLNFELYEQTRKEKYLNNTISLHESAIYNRIRTKLNTKKNLAFANVPKAIIVKETELKDAINSSLKNNTKTIEGFFETTKNWEEFLNSLKQSHPKYYEMRYATIEESLDNIQQSVPSNTTVIRYLFIEDRLYAYITDKDKKTIISLNYDPVKNHIMQLGENQGDIQKTGTTLYELYQQLWLPISDKITTQKIVIIPDGPLFNLSFETLTPVKMSAFKELATNSLLAKYDISYNYSLFLLEEGNKAVNTNNFIAFAPEFTDKMKNDYRIAITDSIDLDKTYLTLLPQPFSVDLVKESTRLFGGISFVNEKASKQIFINSAKEHKIIHIGTHAESNNVSPELSRLIFAKNSTNEDNSLYTYEIYNQNLSSDLAILTACETGKPTYQAGEGMISLAHAFNYAGSESILTSLWKIDEQSSTKILELFYQNISKGLSKDASLRQAKLDYISTAEGRTISPQYWAGLVLIGDTSPIDLSSQTNYWIWFNGLLIFLTILFLFFKRRNSQKG